MGSCREFGGNLLKRETTRVSQSMMGKAFGERFEKQRGEVVLQ